MLIENSRWMPHNSCETILPSDWLTLFLSKFQHGKDWSNTQERWEGCFKADEYQGRSTCPTLGAFHTSRPPSPNTRTPARPGGESCSSAVGGSGEVTRVITNPTVHPDGCRGWAIYVGWGRSQLTRCSNLPWEARPPGRNFCGLHHWRSPQSTDLWQWLFTRFAGFKRAQSSSFGKSPSHS